MASHPSAAASGAATERTLGLLCAVLGALGFSFKAILVKAAYRYPVDAETLLCLRMGYALPLLALMAWQLERRDPRALSARDWSELLLLGVLGYYLASYLDFLGLRYISAALERIVLFVYPTLVVMLSALFLHKALTWRTALLLLFSYAGVAIAVAPEVRLAGHNTLLGVALVLLSALSFAIYLMRSGQIVLRLRATRVTAYATGIACVLCMLQFVAMRPVRSLEQPWQVHALAGAMAVFSTVVPIWLVTEAIRRLGAPTAAMFGALGPIFTIVLAWALLHEPISAAQLAGAVIVILAVTRMTRS
ncbi:MAG TPA: DMT family transporter [Steroidobacteraceae bacterium]